MPNLSQAKRLVRVEVAGMPERLRLMQLGQFK
jgi:hypothetical protein